MRVRVYIALFVLAAVMGMGGPLSSSQSLGGITLTEVTPRVMTPNNDNHNDVIFFKFDSSLSGLPLTTAVYDASGAKVSELRTALGDTSLTWDGRNDNGSLMPSGIYIYSIQIGKNNATGTVVVAR